MVKKVRSISGLLARGQLPLDPDFLWVDEVLPQLSDWQPLLAQAYQSSCSNSPTTSAKACIRATNRALVSLPQLGLPSELAELYVSNKRITFAEYAEAVGISQISHSALSLYRLGYNLMVTFFDAMLEHGNFEKDGGLCNPFLKEEIPKSNPETVQKALLVRGTPRLDDRFEWLDDLSPELAAWKAPLADAYWEVASKTAKSNRKGVLSEINKLILSLSELSLPADPEGFFSTELTLNFDRYLSVAYELRLEGDIEETRVIKRHRSQYNLMLEVLEEVRINSVGRFKKSRGSTPREVTRVPLIRAEDPPLREKSVSELVALERYPLDPSFEWLHELGDDYSPWISLMRYVYSACNRSEREMKMVLRAMNKLLVSLPELGVPLDPRKAFKMESQITLDDLQKKASSSHGVVSRHNEIVRGFDCLVEENRGKPFSDGVVYFDDNSVNPLAYVITERVLRQATYYTNPSLRYFPETCTLPADDEFGWLHLLGTEFVEWELLFKKVFNEKYREETGQSKRTTYLIGHIFCKIKRLKLPVKPAEFFSAGLPEIGVEDFYLKFPELGTATNDTHKSYFGNVVEIFELILRTEYSELDPSGFIVVPSQYKNPFVRSRPKLWHDRNSSFDCFDALEEFYKPWKLCLEAYIAQDVKDERAQPLVRHSLIRFFTVFLRQELISLDPHILLGGLNLDVKYQDFLKKGDFDESTALRRRSHVYDALDYAVKYFTKELQPSDGIFASPILDRGSFKITGRSKKLDKFVSAEPKLTHWAAAVEKYLSTLKVQSIGTQRAYCATFLEYLAATNQFSILDYIKISSDTELKAHWERVKPGVSEHSYKRFINTIYDFIEWIRLDLAESDTQRIGHNPLFKLRYEAQGISKPKPSETVKAEIPRYLVDHMSDICFPDGADSFKELEFIHSSSKDWFIVTESFIDKNDPDCVWKVEKRASGEDVYKVWNPSIAVMFLLLCHTALRGHQIRCLDSGEGDSYRYVKDGYSGFFQKNTSPLAPQSSKQCRQQGVFYLQDISNLDDDCKALYVNTNKTADLSAGEEHKGYVTPVLNNHVLLFWLTKMRDWQEKYNPISALTKWEDIPSPVIGVTNKSVIKRRLPASFLFRNAAGKDTITRNSPVGISVFRNSFRLLMEALEPELEARGIARDDGEKIRLFHEDALDTGYRKAIYTVHSFRVGMINYLMMDLGVPIEIISKMIAGHASVVMTLYYTKFNQAMMAEVLEKVELNSIDAVKRNAIRQLENLPYEQLTESFAGLDISKAAQSAKDSPASSYLFTNVGICPVGGNKCNVGGELENDAQGSSRYLPVAGFPKQNCIRCRFNLTNPAFLPGLVARFNEASWHLSNLSKKLPELHQEKLDLEDLQHANQLSDLPFGEAVRLKSCVERLKELSSQISEVINDMQAAHHLIQMCMELSKKGGEMSLVATGDIENIEAALIETKSELYSTAVLCQNAEIYKTFDAGKATLRQAQILDLMLESNDMPPLLYKLDEAQQLLAGNELMRLLQRHTPNKTIGEAVPFAEGRKRLNELGIIQETIEEALHITSDRAIGNDWNNRG